jgi:NAD(P)-dependent dehydrogenase (short-subunit alcohol dehydrogenase family)
MELLRADLLGGRTIVLVGGAGSVAERLAALGARVVQWPREEGGPDGDEEAEAWARSHAPIDAIVCDVGFDPANGTDALAAVDAAWPAVRAVAAGAMIPGAETARVADPRATRKVLLLGPPPEGGRHAEAARASLEILARTLSVEWARFSIVATMIAPGESTTVDDIQTLVAFLCSRAGDYYSGCRFELGAVTPAQ